MGQPAPSSPPPASGDRPSDDLSAALASPAERIAARDVMVVVAHPDDETIGLGAQLPRLHGVTLVHVTDGAPRYGDAAAAHGFATWQDYARARRGELEAAMALAGIGPASLIGLGVPDQEVCLDLAGLARRLARLFRERGVRTVVTHAYEGGHPDHDGVSFAVHAAARLLVSCQLTLEILEMPLYHLGTDGWEVQRFVPGSGGDGVTLPLGARARRAKRAMLDAYRSQAGVLSMMTDGAERVRPAPAYDFAVLPNAGRLLYERYGWGMTGARFQGLAAQAAATLGLSR